MTDYIVKQGDRVFVFGSTSMYEYRWEMANGNEMLDLFKVWQSDNLSEDIKDKLRQSMRDKNQPQPPR